MEWEKIKAIIKKDTESIFKNGNPIISNFGDGIDSFFKVVFHKVGSFELDGLNRELPKSLQNAYIEEVGELNSLKTISTSLDPFLKKILIIANLETTQSVKGKTLRPLLEKTGLILPTTPKIMEPINPESYKIDGNYLEQICEAYQTRNKVHESPDFSRIEVIKRLTSVMVTYILVCLKFRNEINRLPDIQNTIRKEESIKISKEQKYIYHLISYGNTTNKLKNQIITSYILNYLSEIEEISIEEIQEKTNIFFSNLELPLNFFKSLISKLIEEERILKSSNKIRLTDNEKSKISKIQKDFELNKNIFNLYIEEIIQKYNLNVQPFELYQKLESFFEDNYSIDIAESLDKGVDIVEDENKLFSNFISYLTGLTQDRNIANTIFKELIELSKDSDFLLRMCAGKTFASLTNPERFEQYVNEETRTVYLDTQIILFALCLNYSSKVQYTNFQYETTEELIKLQKRNSNIKYKVAKFYIQEVAYQLKLALLLIPLEEIGGERISNNIFYQFYWYLKQNDILDPEDNNFSNFLSSWFLLQEDDAYDYNFFSIVHHNLIGILEDQDLNITVEFIEPAETKYDASEIIKGILSSDRKTRSKNVIENDANMLAHLCNSKSHSIEPFFLTWDKEFIKFRKDYLAKFKRGELLSFHLFNPSKFINHISLLKFKINPSAMSNGLISIMDTYNIHENTSTIWDIINKYLNVDNIKKQQRRRNINTLKEVFEGEFGLSLENFKDMEKSIDLAQNIDETIIKITDYYARGNKHSLTDYRKLFLSDDYFKKATSILLKSISEKDLNTSFEKMNLLIEEMNKGSED